MQKHFPGIHIFQISILFFINIMKKKKKLILLVAKFLSKRKAVSTNSGMCVRKSLMNRAITWKLQLSKPYIGSCWFWFLIICKDKFLSL